ncbi:SHOCT domain-containing protein [Mycetocola zhadangensis]|uniref:SHOCT domain-containing protein n=1 Tax=Mycetocola zhadangensis TaxID=1164595 RepID=A0A3L7J7H6_9MICO|nr:SHOCT domain-containing protein [Mycetocola zhadangensis]RLQ86374.1 SHOCT domain-containing protein [Mycetocola zhadangensis]GGE90662.1 membrane protein [Mycetocola zhadangensis]
MNWFNDFWDVIVWFLWIYVVLAYLITIVFVLGDIFRDHSLSGWLKALWVICLVFVPILTVLVYVIARGKGMSERNARGPVTVSEPDDYHPHIYSPSPTDQIAQAQGLLASGSITADEFAALKAKAMA